MLAQHSSLDHICAIVITYNEEDNLQRTLNMLTQLSEVIVLDSFSTDRTREIAESFSNVRFVERVFDNLMNQWNYGHTLTERNWILSLDADYRLSDTFVVEISTIDQRREAYSAAFRYCVDGEPVRGALLPPRIVFYNKQKCWYTQDGHAQHLNVNGSTGHLKSHIYHDDRKPLSRWLNSQNTYADQEISKLYNPAIKLRGVDKIRMKSIFAPFLVFVYTLIFKGTIWNGKRGVFYAFQRMYAELILLLKRLDRNILESKRKQL